MTDIMVMDTHPAEYLGRWRRTIFFDVIGIVSNPKAKEQQLVSGVWPMVSHIPFPSSSQSFKIVTGCMTFGVSIGNHELFISIWLRPGEVRIGVKIPSDLIVSDQMRSQISKAYNGNACSRIETMGKTLFFDWIWLDQAWSGFAFMMKSITSPIEASVISEQIADCLMHIYLSVMHTLLNEKLQQEVTLTENMQPAFPYWYLIGHGNLLALASFARERSWVVDRAIGLLGGDSNESMSTVYIPNVADHGLDTFPYVINNDLGVFTITSFKKAH